MRTRSTTRVCSSSSGSSVFGMRGIRSSSRGIRSSSTASQVRAGRFFSRFLSPTSGVGEVRASSACASAASSACATAASSARASSTANCLFSRKERE